MDNSGQKMPVKISQDISECNNAWSLYLQGLAGLCSAGARVSHSLQVLAHGMPVGTTAGQCRSAWDELLRATQAAALSVRTEVTSGMRELASLDDQNARSSEDGGTQLQYHQQQQQQQYQQQQQQISPSSAETASYRHQQLFCRLLGGQRRWSEVAARRTTERDDEGDEGAPRRWSVPWEGPGAGGVSVSQHQLTVPFIAHERCSRSTTPDSASLASQEELQEVISLLSCRPVTQLHPNSRQLPGVVLTNCSQSDNRESWPPVPLFPKDTNPTGPWYQVTVDGGSHSEGNLGCSQTRRGGSPRPAQFSRARAGWTPHEPLYTTIWGEQEVEESGGNLELFAPSQPENNCQIYPRKSSSSTDSSSSSSLPQHTTANTTPEQQKPGHLYSMWSGSEMAPSLPFIQLPLSPNHPHTENIGGTMLP